MQCEMGISQSAMCNSELSIVRDYIENVASEKAMPGAAIFILFCSTTSIALKWMENGMQAVSKE